LAEGAKFCDDCGATQTKKCPSCKFDNKIAARFCLECGFDMTVKICPSCGSENKTTDRYCNKCGLEMAAPPPTRFVPKSKVPKTLHLDNDEEVVYNGHRSWVNIWVLLAFFPGVIFYFIPTIIAIWWVRSSKYAITTKKVWVETGMLGKKTIIARGAHITDITERKSFFDRLFGIGTLAFNTPGSPEKEICFKSIDTPSQISKLAQGLLNT
jgi:hypothetical protein